MELNKILSSIWLAILIIFLAISIILAIPESFIWVHAALWILTAIGMIFFFYFIGLIIKLIFSEKSIAGHN
jgi:hypothetical protein